MSLPSDLIAQAIGMSAKNRPTTANAENELRTVLGRLLKKYIAAGADVNPFYFATTAPVAGVAGVWSRPAKAESVVDIRTAADGPVVVVPFDERTANHGKPRLYRLGTSYHTVGLAGDPGATDSLTFYYVLSPDIPAAMNTPVDARWPEAYDGLLVTELAIYLAAKDGRAEEVGGLETERDGWVAIFQQFLKHETMNEIRQFQPHRFTELVQKPVSGGTPT